MENAHILAEARGVLEAEAEALMEFASRLGREDGNRPNPVQPPGAGVPRAHDTADALGASFIKAVRLLAGARVIVSGMGKSGHIARKIASTFSSTGTPAFFLHPAECAHGDFGVLCAQDAVVLLSKSGETAEVVNMLPHIKRLPARIISITNTAECTLARMADVPIVLGVQAEACPFNLAPTTSTTVMLALGDALAIALMRGRSFGREDFARNHPAGRAGRMLLQVQSLMQREDIPCVTENAALREALLAILNRKNRGIALILDAEGRLAGVVCDGDLKRLLLKHECILDLPLQAVMTPNPQTIAPDALVGEALARMEGRFTSLVVVDSENRPLGLLHIHDILEARLV
jgi:arabinose-5-phosphate isomerase